MEKSLKTITVLGAGSWGTALAMVLADNHHNVNLWGHNSVQMEEINSRHTNEKYLKNVQLPEEIKGYTDLGKALEGTETVILAVPTKAVREVLQKVQRGCYFSFNDCTCKQRD